MPAETKTDTEDARLALCRYIRSPVDGLRPKDAEERRLAIYKRLFFSNIKGFIDETFPLLRGYFSDSAWTSLVRSFMRDHRCQTPYFREISREFLLYLEYEYDYRDDDPLFMLELAHYQWVSLTVEIAPQEIPAKGIHPDGDLLKGCPQLSPLLCSLRYQYPVHTITKAAEQIAPVENGVYLMVCRDRAYEIKRIQGSAITAELLARAASGEQSGEQILRDIAKALGREDVDAVVRNGGLFMERLRKSDMILGTRA